MSAQRRSRHEHVGRVLQRLDDDGLCDLLAAGQPLSEGIGGTGRRIDVDGIPVFAKQLPLTDLERRPEHWGCTAEFLGLPLSCHYGIGSPGFTVWRELAAATTASAATLAGRASHFPLVHHWRVLPWPGDAPPPLPAELADIDAAVAYWEHSNAMRRRLEGMASASATVTLFCEYLPTNVHEWLTGQARHGEAALTAALNLLVPQLHELLAWLDRYGWAHMDAHFENILTDGQRLYLTDFALALLPTFHLSPAERDFAAAHATYDASYVLTHLISWLMRTLTDVPPDRQDQLLAAAASGTQPAGMPAGAAELVVRYAPVAAVVRPFYRQLQTQTRAASYPDQSVRQVLGH